jgi:hypothetical protein
MLNAIARVFHSRTRTRKSEKVHRVGVGVGVVINRRALGRSVGRLASRALDRRACVRACVNRVAFVVAVAMKKNRRIAAARIADAQRIERDALKKKEEKRLKKLAEAEANEGGMAVDSGSGKRRVTTNVKGGMSEKGIRTAQASALRVNRKTAGVEKKKREGKNTHKLVRGVLLTGKVKLRKNAVVKGIKVVDAATKQMALDAIAAESGAATNMDAA